MAPMAVHDTAVDRNSVTNQRMRCMKQDVISLTVAIFISFTVFVAGLFSTLPSLGAPPLPSFDTPLKGFEPRGTSISNRLYTVDLLDEYVNKSKLVVDKSSNINSSPPRKRRSTTNKECSENYEGRLAFASKTSSNLFTPENLKSMCFLEKTIMKSSPSSFDSDYLGGCPNCCTSFSLGGVVAQLNNKTTCEDIDDNDVANTLNILKNCIGYLSKGLLKSSCVCTNFTTTGMSENCPSVPCICSWKKMILTTLYHLVDNEFLKTPSQTNLKYSAILSPTKLTSNTLYRNIYDSHFSKGVFPENQNVKVVGFDFASFRFYHFDTVVVENIIYPAIALAFVVVFMWFFLKSLILSLFSMLTIIFALVLSYFLYMVAFGFKFFSFLNLLTLVFIVGIGADDAFVYYDIFRQTKSAYPNDSLVTLTMKTLKDAALSMFVTSFTTSAAFFANVISDITSIKLFAIFAGISILTNYLLMITWFPVVVILHERWVRKNKVDQRSKSVKVGDAPEKRKIDHRDGSIPKLEGTPDRNACCLICWGIDFPCHFCCEKKTLFSRIGQKVFHEWLPNAILKWRLYFLWIFLFVGLTIGFACVCLVSPGLRLPTTKDFQLFSSSSIIEKYNLQIKDNFRYSVQGTQIMTVELIWGVKPTDNGNYLDPDDKGVLEYDNSFDPEFTPAAQLFLSSFCNSLSNQTFFTGDITSSVGGSLCSVETIKRRCSQPTKDSCCKNATFPFSSDVIDGCMTSWNISRPIIYYEKSNTYKARAMSMYFQSNVFWSAQYNPMDTFWNQIHTWSKEHFQQAPSAFKNGWAISRQLYLMYSIQFSLQKGTLLSLGISISIAFCVMLLTTLNVFISVYAILTIVGIISMTIGSLVLMGWELNVLESMLVSVAIGLSIDFTVHYGVAYRLAPQKDKRKERVRYSFIHIGSAIFMAAVTTFIAGALMQPADVLVYIQLGKFLMLVMVFSWVFANFAFLSLGALIGPVGNFGQLSISSLCARLNIGASVSPSKEKKITSVNYNHGFNHDAVDGTISNFNVEATRREAWTVGSHQRFKQEIFW